MLNGMTAPPEGGFKTSTHTVACSSVSVPVYVVELNPTIITVKKCLCECETQISHMTVAIPLPSSSPMIARCATEADSSILLSKVSDLSSMTGNDSSASAIPSSSTCRVAQALY